MSAVRALLFNLLFFGWTAAIGILALPLLAGGWRVSARFGRWWSGSVLLLLRLVVGLDYEVRGPVPRGACIVAMKHQSAWDTIAVPVLLDDPAIVIKRELLWLPVYGWYARRAGSIAVDRQGGAGALRGMVAAARRAAAEGRPIVIFPQGTRTAPGARRAYQPGVAALYQALGLPLVPAAVNSGLYWGRRSFMKRRGRIVVAFLEPIPPGLPRRRLMAELESRIETATDALLREAGGERRGNGPGAQGPPARLQ